MTEEQEQVIAEYRAVLTERHGEGAAAQFAIVEVRGFLRVTTPSGATYVYTTESLRGGIANGTALRA